MSFHDCEATDIHPESAKYPKGECTGPSTPNLILCMAPLSIDDHESAIK